MKLQKNTKAFDILSKVSGIPKNKILKIALGVLENNKLLNSCSYHIFEPIDDDPLLSRRFVCRNCKGIVDSIRRAWYERGIEHS